MLVIERLHYDPDAWEGIVSGYPEAEVFHGAAWLDFLARSQGAEPVVATVRDQQRVVGHFVGGIVRRFGIRILGSPLRGWGTQSMGFLLQDGVDRRAAAAALIPFAFDGLDCHHVELVDRRLGADEMARSGYVMERGETYVVDLARPEEEILRAMRRTTRQEIRKAIRAGLVVEPAADRAFADEFYGYLTAVFARQGKSPTYGVDRVRHLIAAVHPSGQLLLLRVRTAAGRTVGTALVVGRNETAVAWGMAFDRANQEVHAVELMWLETMRYWGAHGAIRFDMGGGGGYKAKYGGAVVELVRGHRSRYRALRLGRAILREFVSVRQIMRGRVVNPRKLLRL